MAHRETLKRAFVNGLGLPPGTDVEPLAYQGVPEWDSVGHMQLINEIETAFDLMLPTGDVLALSSFAKACEIVARHGVDLDG
jgi:hypothetical protein